MKMMIEVQGGVVVSITATQECSLYIVDHDNIKTMYDLDGTMANTTYAREAMQPDCITWEESEDNTPEFDGFLDEALSEYETKGEQQ